MEFTKLGGSDDPVEGSNVSFICLLFWGGGKSNSKNQVKWSFIKTESKEPVPLNDYVLPGGLKKKTYYVVLDVVAKDCMIIFPLSKEWKLEMKYNDTY